MVLNILKERINNMFSIYLDMEFILFVVVVWWFFNSNNKNDQK